MIPGNTSNSYESAWMRCFQDSDDNSRFLLKVLSIVLLLLSVFEVFAIERRRPQITEDLSYFFYPLAYQVPGLGAGQGLGSTVINGLGNGSTISLLGVRGDIEVDSIVLTDVPIFTSHFTLSMVYADGNKGGFAYYGRGRDSSPEPEFTLEFGRSYGRALELGLNFFDRQLEFYVGGALAFPEIDYETSDLANFDELENRPPSEQENEIAKFVKNLLKYYNLNKIYVSRRGLLIDYTDDRTDPRSGIRFNFENYFFEGEGLTNFHTYDYSLTSYFPNADSTGVLVGNIFFSSSEVTKALGFGEFDYDQCLKDGKGSEEISIDTLCKGVERGFNDFNQNEAANSSATALGGPNRLRSYPVARFYDKYSFFAGIEYRFYFLEQLTPFDFLLEKGTFEALQLAPFYEVGQVSDSNDDTLFQNFKYSAGIGLRIVLSSVIFRADVANGGEGSETTILIGYGF